jgi:hypothetical protein
MSRKRVVPSQNDLKIYSSFMYEPKSYTYEGECSIPAMYSAKDFARLDTSSRLQYARR